MHNPLKAQPETYHRKKNYDFKDVLGSGSFSTVRRALDRRTDPPMGVAVKVISKKILKGHDEIVQQEMDVLKVRLGAQALTMGALGTAAAYTMRRRISLCRARGWTLLA